MNLAASAFILEADDTLMAIVSGTWFLHTLGAGRVRVFERRAASSSLAVQRGSGGGTRRWSSALFAFPRWCQAYSSTFAPAAPRTGRLPARAVPASDRRFAIGHLLYGRIVLAACV